MVPESDRDGVLAARQLLVAGRADSDAVRTSAGKLAGYSPSPATRPSSGCRIGRRHSVARSISQGLGSRDDAAYLQQLGRGEPGASAAPAVNQVGKRLSDDPIVQVPHDPARALLRSADDSRSIASLSKNLASWGGFRQHYIDQNKSGGQGQKARRQRVGSRQIPKEWRLRIQESSCRSGRDHRGAAQAGVPLLEQELEKLYTSST